MAVYIVAGRFFRSHLQMPLFVYVFPVTITAAVTATIASLLAEGAGDGGVAFGAAPAFGVFGWLRDGRMAAVVLALGFVSGIMGHTLTNLTLRHLPVLVVSVALLLEPVVGSVIGYLAGVQSVPHGWTFGGGAVLLLGALLVTVGGRPDPKPDTQPQDGDTDDAGGGNEAVHIEMAHISAPVGKPPSSGDDEELLADA